MPRARATVVRPAHRPLAGGHRARGFATLGTVLALLALAAWAAAASHRALVSELRAAASQWRAAEAFEAAQAGLDLALALLQAGPLDAACTGAAAPARALAEWLELGPVELACLRLEGGWACRCPPAGPGAAAEPPAPAPPAFRVEATRIGTGSAVQLRAIGQGAGATGRATVSVLAAPSVGASPPGWRRLPGSWRDF